MKIASGSEPRPYARARWRCGTSLVRNVLAYSRPQAPAGESANVDEALQRVLWLRPQLEQRSIAFDIEMPTQRTRVQLGTARLEQVLTNLITNARDALPVGGRIQIRAESAWRSPWSDGLDTGPQVRITVTDNGASVPADVLPRIFELYFTTKSASGGTRLGLATCYAVVRSVGGTIAVTSAPEHGTPFTILLPQVDGDAEA